MFQKKETTHDYGTFKIPCFKFNSPSLDKYEINFALNIRLFLFPTSLYKNNFQESHIKNVFSAIFKQKFKLIFKVMSEFVNDMEMVNNVMSEQSK